MTLMRDTPKDYVLLLHHDKNGNRLMSVKHKDQRAKCIRTVYGATYSRCFSHASRILSAAENKKLIYQDEQPSQRHPITEDRAYQFMLLMESADFTIKEEVFNGVGAAIADMHPAESSWWYACWAVRNRPHKILEALELMYA